MEHEIFILSDEQPAGPRISKSSAATEPAVQFYLFFKKKKTSEKL